MKNVKNAVFRFENLKLTVLPLRTDNYSYVVENESTKQTLVVDPSESKPVKDWLEAHKLGLNWIVDTHHHNDHVEGNVYLKGHFKAKIAAPEYDIKKDRIPGSPDLALRDGDYFDFGNYRFRVLATPGHTLGHICLYLEEANWLFSGDTLFSLGCGRLFEGTGSMLWESFLKLRALPDETLVFCGHEYTLANAKFIEDVLPEIEGFHAHHEGERRRLDTEKKTIPARLGDEKKWNPYFLADHPSLQKYGDTPVDVFSKIRSLKDSF